MTKRLVPILAAAMLWAGALPAATPPSGGSISIEPKTADGEYDPSMPAFVAGAADAFETRGFVVLEDGHAAYVVELTLSRTDVGTGTAKIPAGRAGAGGGGPGASVGVGVRIPLSSGQTALVPLQRVRLEMRIRKRGEQAVLWDGAAVTVRAAGTKRGANATVAADLSAALMRAYPNQPEDVIGVP